MARYDHLPSAEFTAAVADAIRAAAADPLASVGFLPTQLRLGEDPRVLAEAVRYMTEALPVYAQTIADPAQARAGGCPGCIYRGLWANRWTGPDGTVYEASKKHGLVFLFEDGIRGMGGSLYDQVFSTLLHEYDHALDRDHVLEAIGHQKRTVAGSAHRRGSCGSCGR